VRAEAVDEHFLVARHVARIQRRPHQEPDAQPPQLLHQRERQEERGEDVQHHVGSTYDITSDTYGNTAMVV
jgi:hypothetical protein